jgi:hypothetical protein
MVVVQDKYEGTTEKNRKTIERLRPGETNVLVFAEGYGNLTRRILLEEGKPAEEKFSLTRTPTARSDIARSMLLKAVANLGGVDGLIELGDLEGAGNMQWTNSSGMMEQWTLTFNKRAGKDLSMTFKSDGGQCTSSILAQAVKQECRGGLRNGGDKIAEQGTSLFLSYQLQDVLHTLLNRPVLVSETDDKRLESADAKDSYVLTIGDHGLPTGLIYKIGDSGQPIHVEYSNYVNLEKGRYPRRISIGRMNSAPAWVFTLNNIRSRALRNR